MLVKYKKPTDISFYTWIRNYPESFHPSDMENFYRFVKTACRYKAKRWLSPIYLKKKILEEKPNMDEGNLDYFLVLMEHLCCFHKTSALTNSHMLLGEAADAESKKHPGMFRLTTVKEKK